MNDTHGGLLVNNGPSVHDDCILLGQTRFSTLSFTLRDSFGVLLNDIRGSISFTLVFVQ
jgi:hypothetical protein